MGKKVKTISLKGKAYAQVKDRLAEFRTENPNGLVETSPQVTDTHIIFKARVLKDKSDPNSAEATGHSMGELVSDSKKEKVFEKQETIAVGRALALLGYGTDGEIASSEEMEEFLKHKKEKHDKLVASSKKKLEDAKTPEKMRAVWSLLPLGVKKELEEFKNELKKKHENTKV